jgi:hypothetical protein
MMRSEPMKYANPPQTSAVELIQQSLGVRIRHAHNQLQHARSDGNYAAVCRWRTQIDNLLDRWNEIRARAG